MDKAAVLTLLFSIAAPVAAQQFTFRRYDQRDGLSNLSIAAPASYGSPQKAGCPLRVGARLKIGRAEGLPGTITAGLTDDAGGRVWVGTSDGLAVFNGSRFETVVFDEKPIAMRYGNSLTNAPDGTVYVRIAEDVLAIGQQPRRGWVAKRLNLPVQRGGESSTALLALHHGSLLFGRSRYLCETRDWRTNPLPRRRNGRLSGEIHEDRELAGNARKMDGESRRAGG